MKSIAPRTCFRPCAESSTSASAAASPRGSFCCSARHRWISCGNRERASPGVSRIWSSARWHIRELAERDLMRLWIRGGFPRSFLAPTDADSALWRESFIRTYLERDIPAFGPRVPADHAAPVLDHARALPGRSVERRRAGQKPRRGRQDRGPVCRLARGPPARAPIATVPMPTSARDWQSRPRSTFATAASFTRCCGSTTPRVSSATRSPVRAGRASSSRRCFGRPRNAPRPASIVRRAVSKSTSSWN